MTRPATYDLIAALAREAEPVTPLPSPLRRGLATLGAFALAGAALIAARGDMDGLAARYAGRETLMLLEMGAMLATALLGVIGAFFVSIPGRSRLWLYVPLPAFALWIGLTGLGCYQDLLRLGPAGWTWGHGKDCLVFLLSASLLVGAPLLWRLSRARPLDPLPVALLGGLGAAALAAFLLQFFHPAALTALDLLVHVGAVLLVIALAAVSRRRSLAPA